MSETGGGTPSPVLDVYPGSTEAPAATDAETVQEASAEGYDEAIAAAKAALADGKHEGDTADPTVTEPEAVAKPAEDPDKLLTDIERTLEQRRTEAREKLKVREEIAREKAEVERYRAEVSHKEREVLEAANYIRKLRSDPAAAVRALGIEPEDFIAQLANGSTAEYKQKSEMETLRQEHAQLRRQLEERTQREQQEREQYQVQQVQYRQQRAEHEFIQTAATDDFPTLAKIHQSGRSQMILAEANDVAERYYQATGKAASYRDIAEYLEHQYVTALGLQTQPQQGKPPQGKRGAASLGSIQPERSSGIEPSKDDSDEEALKKAIAATRAELKHHAG